MENNAVENVVVVEEHLLNAGFEVVGEKETLALEDVLVLGKYLDLVSELQFKKQAKILAQSDDVNVQKFLKQLVKLNDTFEAKLEDTLEQYKYDYDEY